MGEDDRTSYSVHIVHECIIKGTPSIAYDPFHFADEEGFQQLARALNLVVWWLSAWISPEWIVPYGVDRSVILQFTDPNGRYC